MIVIRQVAEVIGAIMQVLCGFQKNKKNLLKWQIADNVSGAVANALAGGWISVISRTVALIRDTLVIRIRREDIQKTIPSILVVIGLIISIFTSDHAVWGYIAIGINFLYSLSITASGKNAIIGPKIFQALSRIAWGVYHFQKTMYVFAVSDIITAIASIVILAQLLSEFHRGE